MNRASKLTKRKYAKIVVKPPGPKSRAIHERESKLMRHMSQLYSLTPVHMDRGEQFLLTDVDGNRYIDFASGVVATAAGHCHPKVVKALKEQAEKLIFSYVWGPKVRLELLEKLTELGSPLGLKKFGIATSGAEANECAVKIALAHTKRSMFVSFYGGFSGKTLMCVGLSGDAHIRKSYYPLSARTNVISMPYPYCYRCLFNQEYPDCDLLCFNYMEQALSRYESPEDIAAFFVEAIQGPNNCIVPPDEFLPRLKKLAESYGALLIVDDVQTFPGRSGKLFAVQHVNVKPDILTASKGVASGVPIGITMCREDIQPIGGGTFSANPLSCAGALANLEAVIEDRLPENAAKVGGHMIKRLKDFAEESKIVGAVHGRGLLIGVELVKDKKTKEPAYEESRKVLIKCMERGVIMLYAGLFMVNTPKITPPLNITMEAADEGLDIFEEAVKEVEKGI